MKTLKFKLQENGSDMDGLILESFSMGVVIAGEHYQLEFEKEDVVRIPLKMCERGRGMVALKDIVLIRPCDDEYAKRSNNKTIVLNGRGSDTLCDFSVANRMHELCIDSKVKFLEVDRATLVNVSYIAEVRDNKVEVRYSDIEGNERTEMIAVSKRNIARVRREVKNRKEKR